MIRKSAWVLLPLIALVGCNSDACYKIFDTLT